MPDLKLNIVVNPRDQKLRDAPVHALTGELARRTDALVVGHVAKGTERRSGSIPDTAARVFQAGDGALSVVLAQLILQRSAEWGTWPTVVREKVHEEADDA